jgi:hypothetical protein
MNIESVFLQLNGRELDYRELRAEVQRVLASLTSDLPAELSTRDVFETAASKGWIVNLSPGLFRISIPNTTSYHSRSVAAG